MLSVIGKLVMKNYPENLGFLKLKVLEKKKKTSPVQIGLMPEDCNLTRNYTQTQQERERHRQRQRDRGRVKDRDRD